MFAQNNDKLSEVLDVLSEQIERAYEYGQREIAEQLEYCYRELNDTYEHKSFMHVRSVV